MENRHPAERTTLGRRLREIRIEEVGEHGMDTFAQAVGVPMQTWDYYERGVTIPGAILLQVLVLTHAEPHWLLTGEGPRRRSLPYGAVVFRDSSFPANRLQL